MDVGWIFLYVCVSVGKYAVSYSSPCGMAYAMTSSPLFCFALNHCALVPHSPNTLNFLLLFMRLYFFVTGILLLVSAHYQIIFYISTRLITELLLKSFIKDISGVYTICTQSFLYYPLQMVQIVRQDWHMIIIRRVESAALLLKPS